MAHPSTDAGTLQCPNCAGQCLYSPARSGLECQSCGDVRSLQTDEDQVAEQEFPYDPDKPVAEFPFRSVERVHSCTTCGGQVMFTGAALSERCPYCDGAVVLGERDEGYETMALVPFRVTRNRAQELAEDWIGRRLAAPGTLKSVAKQGRMAGLYAPFWTFDSHEALDYWAKYTVRRGKRRVVRHVSGSMETGFDDMLVPASHHITPLIRDGILHDFDPASLRPYQAGYLAGFAAERHHQSVADGLATAEPDKRLLIRNRIKSHIRKSGVFDITYKTDTSGIHYRRVLLPVWILHYSWKGNPMKIVVSGIDGRTFGERPFSAWKVAAYSAFLSALAIGTGWAWGAAGLL